MAGGFVYTAVDQGQLATAEIYGKALSDIIMRDPKVVAITADLAKSTKLGDVLKVCPERVINVDRRAGYVRCCSRYGKSRYDSLPFRFLCFHINACL